jgi:REP element-mobilizing transposase RayT
MSSDGPVTTQFERRHGDLPHWEEPGAIYAIRFSTAGGFEGSVTDAALAKIVASALHCDDGRRYELHAYVLMPDHVHVVLRPLRRGGGAVPLAEVTHALKGVTAHRINAHMGRRGPVWRDESYDRIIRDSREYHETISYIEANPVRAGLVGRADEWPWTWPPSR